MRDPFHFSCYVYNHGQPSNPNLLPADLELPIDEFKVNENTVYDESLKNRICVPDVLGKGLTYCLPGCNDYNFLDFEMGNDIPPCFVGFRGTFTETLISYFNDVIGSDKSMLLSSTRSDTSTDKLISSIRGKSREQIRHTVFSLTDNFERSFH